MTVRERSPGELREHQATVLAALVRGLKALLPDGAEPVDDWRDNFARCVDVELLRALVRPRRPDQRATAPSQADDAGDRRRHALARLIDVAYALASGEPVAGESGPQARQPLVAGVVPVLDRVELTKPHVPPTRYFALRRLTSVAHESAGGEAAEPPIFARTGDPPAQSEIAQYRREFAQQLGRLREQMDWNRFDCVASHLIGLLQAYGWCVPAGTQTNPDVPLYDQVRVASAVAACLYQFHSTDELLDEAAVIAAGQTRCVLLIGGVSGIQDYLFDISTIGAGGVAKRLRARSFIVQLLSEAASLRVLRDFGLSQANLLMAAGARFLVLLPLLADTAKRLEGLQREFDKWMLREYQGTLAVNLGWIDLPDGDFAAGRYDAALARLDLILRRRKRQRLAGAIQNATGWLPEFAREQFVGERVCVSCHRFPATRFSPNRDKAEGEDICLQCEAQQKLGRQLTRARLVSFLEGDDGDIPCLGLSASVGDSPRPNAILAVSLNEPDLIGAARVPAAFRYLANHVPRDDDGAPRDFGDIARSNGLPNGLLGVLKADVDHLGLIFLEGLRRDAPTEGGGTASRLASLSRQVDWFFSGWLEWLLRTKYPDCYTVYSGGDDLLLVGPRGRMLDLARDIREGFARYTQHPQITLSAGLAVVKPKLPLAHTVDRANDALRQAKEGGRNRLCLLGQVIPWDELRPLNDTISRLTIWQPPSSFLYHLLTCSDLWRLYRQDGVVLGLRYHALLALYLARNVDARKQPELHDWVVRLMQFPPQGEVEQLLNRLPVIAQWVLFQKRES